MTNDPGELEPPAPRARHELPDVLSIDTRSIRYEPPQFRNFRSALPEGGDVVEFLVETEAPIPARALGPALQVGTTLVAEVVEVDSTHYRFLAFDPERLAPGARIGLCWSGAPETVRSTSFRYEGVG
ncbi:hypothetical protein AB0A76_29495 [Streptomyces exfoliatus]|uniref:DUF35 domain-containing protein n=1 Tax=Streptomyces exfoliatus TaxID=1905 RepID=A0ABV3D4B1_STREX